MKAALALPRRRWPVLALVASLVLNGFLVGVVAVDWFSPHRRWEGPRVVGFELRRLERRLSPEAHRQVAAALEPLAPALDERFSALRAMRDDIYRMAAGPNPDRAAIDARLAEMRSQSEQLQADVQRATYDALLALPPEMRARLAEPAEPR
jgi:uncharacterized membrane protein